MRHLILLFVLPLLVTLLVTSCAVHPVREEIELPDDLPNHFSLMGDHDAGDHWWRSFQNEDLSSLVAEAVQSNFDIRTAWARLDQFAAQVKLAGAELYPQVNLNTDIRRTVSDQGSFSTQSNQFGINAVVNYEVDLWKRIESQQRAAIFDYQATHENIEATALTISARTVERWIFIVEQKAQLALLHDQIESSKTFLELNELRFSQGRATAVDVYQQRSQLASIQSQIPLVESNIRVFQNQLALLLGQTPYIEMKDIPGQLPVLPPLPKTGVPADVLLQRPDIRAGHQQIVAADYRVASAIADRYPTLRLTGQGGFQTGQIENIFEDTFWNIAAGIVTPIIDGKRRVSEVERNRAIWKERLLSYEQSILTALQEIENALIQEKKQKERVDAAANQLDISRKTLEESQSRFLNGLSDYLPVLTALIEVQRLERQLLSDQRDELLFRVDLHQAMGGDWMSQIKRYPEDVFYMETEQTTETRSQ